MKSINFEFLRQHWELLASLAGFAEQYLLTDPVSSLVKLRSYAEQLVETVYEKDKLQRPYQANLNDLLNDTVFSDVVPEVVITKLHALRIHGNKAAHGNYGPLETAKWLMKEAYQLGQWLYLTYVGGEVSEIQEFKEITEGLDSKDKLKREKKAILEKLAAQEMQMNKLLGDLKKARSQAKAVKADKAQLEEALRKAQDSADTLHFDEAQTRKNIIDSMLLDADWDINNPDSVGQEVEVAHQPTDSGLGYADYVFYGDDGKPLAVLEAKKTSEDAEKGRQQAKHYADGFEKETGQRPIIFYTNGFDLRIWNDKANEPPRSIYSFYSKDSLGYLHYQLKERKPLTNIVPDEKIAGRLYQVEAINRVMERFSAGYRKSLIVQATGTGKTRVAISICECLIKAKWAKRILFLCDRRELRKQAKNAFKEFLPDHTPIIVNRSTYKNKDKRIYLATYPGMMKCFETFDVGFFDLVIADESHRSIYNRYKDLFTYFDAMQVGLTATPVKFIQRNTFQMFNCEVDDPTTNFSFQDAINSNPPYLSSFKVEEVTTEFLREGIKYSQMSEEQRRQLEEQEPDAEAIEYERIQVDKKIFNKPTNEAIIRNLMVNGVKIDDNTRLGKTIIFARSHKHATFLEGIFDKLYPQFGGKFCRVIDNYDPRASALIDEFKDPDSNLTIALSIDMLDTGIDVPEVVNLVFAKPIFSYVKFWQMIGRGTRLCENLFGPGKHKSEFLIFDHWGNFKYFDEEYQHKEIFDQKSLQQRLFESRLDLASGAIRAQKPEVFDLACNIILKDINDLPEKSISVREKWRQVKMMQELDVIKQFSPMTKASLKNDIAPLMQWRNISGHVPAYDFDLLVCLLQNALLGNNSRFDDLRADLCNRLQQLQINLNPVREKLPIIEKVKQKKFWTDVSVENLEDIRLDLRGIMKYRQAPEPVGPTHKYIDVEEDQSLISRSERHPKLEGLELIAYHRRVGKVLQDLSDSCEVLQLIKAGQAITEEQLDELSALVLAQDPDLKLEDLVDYHPVNTKAVINAIRGIVGLDGEVVAKKFEEFAHDHSLNSTQLSFLQMLQNHISKYGSIEIETLYESPFTSFSSDGIDGVFTDETMLDEVFELLDSYILETDKE